jgi:type II secretory pathway predicted ATPase ExeA
LGDQITSAFLTNSHFGSRVGLLQAILYDFSLPYEGRSEQELRLALTDFLLQSYEAGRRAVLIIDEAQHLLPDFLEELRLLGNLEGKHGKALQVILLALPAFESSLGSPELAALRQRLAVHFRLEPLGLHEAADYVVHHLRMAGGSPEVIVAGEALEILAKGTRGVPRLLNRAMHQALHLACTAGQTMVDAETALEIIGLLGLDEPEMAISDSFLAERPGAAQEEEIGSPAVHVLQPEMEGSPTEPAPSDPSRSRHFFVTPRRPA